jgi:hypothetical protein
MLFNWLSRNTNKNFEASNKIIDKDLGEEKRFTASVSEKFCCEEFYHLLENGYVMMDSKRVPTKDGISEYPMVQFYSWQKDEEGEFHAT